MSCRPLIFSLSLVFIACATTSRVLGDEAFNRGVQLYQAKDFDGAINSFRKSSNKNAPVLHYYLANSYASLNRVNDALTEYTTCSLLHPDQQTADLCNQALKRLSNLPPQAAVVPPAKKLPAPSPAISSKPQKMSAMDWANNDDGSSGQRQSKPAAQKWANTPSAPVQSSKPNKPSALDWANSPDSGKPGATKANQAAPSDASRDSFERRLQDQVQDRRADVQTQKAKSKELLDKASSEAAEIKKQAQAEQDGLATYGRRGRYYRGQASDEIKQDAEERSKDVLDRAKAEARMNSKAAQERDRALNSSVQNLHAQMRAGGRGKVRLDPSDSNLYVRNYK